MKKKIILIILTFVFLFAFLNTNVYAVNSIDNGAGNNASNTGYVCNADDGYIYYCNVGKDGKLYRIKNDGSNNQKLSDDISTNILVSKGYVYYRNHSDGGKIYRIDTNGKNKIKLNEYNSGYINIYNDKLYYVNFNDNNKIYYVKIDGTSKGKISNDKNISYLYVSKNYIYYCFWDVFVSKNIYRIDLDGKNKQKLSDDNVLEINVANGYIYYINQSDKNSIYCIKADGTNEKKICNDFATNLNVAGEYIYYRNTSDSFKLYRVKIDGTNRKKLSNDNPSDINVASDWIYYSFYNKSYTTLTFKRMRLDGTESEIWGKPSNIDFLQIKKSDNITPETPSIDNSKSAQYYLTLAEEYDRKAQQQQKSVDLAAKYLQNAINKGTGVYTAQLMYDSACSLLKTYKDTAAKYREMARQASK